MPWQPKPLSLTKAGWLFPAPDFVGRDFTAEKPGEELGRDITGVSSAWQLSVNLAAPRTEYSSNLDIFYPQ